MDWPNAMMAGAIGLVILHAWILTASHNAEHAGHGISRAQSGIADLMAGDPQSVARPGGPSQESRLHLAGCQIS